LDADFVYAGSPSDSDFALSGLTPGQVFKTA
jgi:hypothetical protein